jgi:autotransporter-associated beta strand protein
MNIRCLLVLFVAGVAFALRLTSVHADTYTWTQNAGGAQLWSNGANWLGGVAPSPVAGDLITMNLSMATATNLELGADRTFEDWTGTYGGFGSRAFNINSGNTITLAGATPTITIGGGGVATLTMNNILAGTDGLTKAGANTLALTNAGNTFSGGITLANGILQATSDGALGNASNAITVTGNSALALSSVTYARAVTIDSGVTLSFNTNTNPTISGAVTGAGGISMTTTGFGSYSLTLSSTANTFTGAVQVGNDTAPTLTVNSFADSANNLDLRINNKGNTNFVYGSGAIVPLVLNNRQVILSGNHTTSHVIENANPISDNTITIGKDLSVTSTTARTLVLQGVNNGDNTIGGAIPNGGGATSLTKAGSGRWVLLGLNSYTGTTTVSEGTLLVNGDNSLATGAVTVAATGTLGGIGIVGGNTTLNGTLSPGSSPGTLTFSNNLTVNNGSTYNFEGGDLTAVLGQLDLNDNWTLALGTGFVDGGSVTIFTYGTLAGSPDLVPTFDTTNLGFTPSGSLSLTDTGSSIVLNGISLVPEPSSLAMLAFGAIGLWLFRRK